MLDLASQQSADKSHLNHLLSGWFLRLPTFDQVEEFRPGFRLFEIPPNGYG
jgi:hypothetical protein